MDFDCVIIGGGPAGLTAATYLGRFRRNVLVVDAGHSRALQIPKSRNYPGFAEGMPGHELLRLQRRQAQGYGAKIVDGTVAALAVQGDGFMVTFGGRTVSAARIVMATGLTDKSPDMPGLGEAVAHAKIRYCPVCDAYEATDKRIAVFGSIKDAEAKALFMRSFSKDVTLLPTDEQSDPAARERLDRLGIVLASSPPADLRPADDGIAVELRNGEHLTFDVLYPVLGCEVHSDLAAKLGASCNDVGCLAVDDKQRTTVRDV
jgi:thioredoxin reductase (NADPH)